MIYTPCSHVQISNAVDRQRAFRERKEKHVKELETKLDDLQSATTSLATDNQRLKLMLQKAMTDNEMLRASSGSRRPAPFLLFPDEHTNQGSDGSRHGGKEAAEADDEASDDGDEQERLRRKGKAVFTQAAVWDFLIDHPLISGGHVDIQDAWDRVKNIAKNGVDGPVYLEGDIKRAIQRSRKGGGDALI
jgi:AP-1-like transcription factor